jgi:hypothetical protein
MNDVGEQATGARTALIITNCVEKPLRPAGRSFPFDRAGPTAEYFFSSLQNFHGDYSSAESPRNECTSLFREEPSQVSRRPLFIALRTKNFWPHGPSRLFFFSARAAHLARRGGRARRYFWA